jgi:hypothetical protein
MLSDEESAELADLRRRAWGADADIVDHPAALARLEELEGKTEHPSPHSVVERDGQPGEGSPSVVERARNERDETRPDEAPVPEPSPRRGGARGVLLVIGVVITVVALATGVRSILNPASGPAASPSPTFAFATPRTLPAPQCGDGWGLAGSLSTPEGKPVWSRQFDFPISETWVMPVRGARMVGVWANLDVDPGTISDVEVVSPTTARLFYTAVTTWTIPPSPDEIIANSKPSIVLPVCGSADSYPGLILARAPACVTLEFTVAGTTHYTVRTPVGLDEGARCPTR